MLYLVATPIGNLGDITLRAIEILKTCDYILCEDTRHSRVLLDKYEIDRPLKSYHKFNEAARENQIVEELITGKTIVLISDAGTPGISDPGSRLVKACVEAGVEVISIPGPCAAIQALSCSGLETDRFQFIGFLPRKAQALKRCLQEALGYPGTTICYESPNRLVDVLKTLRELSPQKPVVVARELTKKFEEIQRGSAGEIAEHFELNPPKGEIVLLIKGKMADEKEDAIQWAEWTPAEHIEYYMDAYGMTRQEAIKMVAEVRGLPKRVIYNETMRKENQSEK